MNNLKRIFSLTLAALLCLCVVGCAAEGSGSCVYLDYTNGMDSYGRYNTALYGKNGESDVDGADPGVFYVSTEEDPVWGGYYYMYVTSESSKVPTTELYTKTGVSILAYHCMRSKDLYHWEEAGALAGGFTLAVDKQDWCGSLFWAPEVIRNPSDGKYYMYFSAAAHQGMGLDYISNSSYNFDRLYLGVAVSDSPVGPFDVICDLDPDTGRRIPTVNFQKAYGLDYNVAAIDASPFFDEDGQLYLYFVRHLSDTYTAGNAVCGMRMESMAYPDYSTAVALTAPGAKTLIAEPANALDYEKGENYFSTEGGINEAPFMYKRNGTYYLTYASNGYGSINYGIHQALGTDPLGPFTKLDQSQGNPVHDGGLFGDVHGAGHHSLVNCGDELYAVTHRHCSIYSGVGWARPSCVDRINFVQNSEGVEVMTGNGPSRTLMWLPESVSGYENLAQRAQITASNGTGVRYLTDNVLPIYQVTENCKLSSEAGDVVITLSWDEPVSVSSVMIYNSLMPDLGFSQISRLQFKLAEQPDWASKAYDYAVIENLAIQYGGWDEISEDYLECAPAVAEFDPIMVTEIQITIAESDRLLAYNKQGEANTALNVTEIVVLGGADTNE